MNFQNLVEVRNKIIENNKMTIDFLENNVAKNVAPERVMGTNYGTFTIIKEEKCEIKNDIMRSYSSLASSK